MRSGADYLKSLNDGRQVFVDGEKVADHNMDRVATIPLVVPINPDDPPPWLRPAT